MTVIEYIRTRIFQMSRAEFAEQVAECDETTVWRWEQGHHDPTLHYMRNIRNYAIKRRYDWDDSIWFRRLP